MAIQIPARCRGIAATIHPQQYKFFVAKVNLALILKRGLTYLRPLQMAFESPKFMLPIRLGMANAKKEQDLIVFALSRAGRTEVTNYRDDKHSIQFQYPDLCQR